MSVCIVGEKNPSYKEVQKFCQSLYNCIIFNHKYIGIIYNEIE